MSEAPADHRTVCTIRWRSKTEGDGMHVVLHGWDRSPIYPGWYCVALATRWWWRWMTKLTEMTPGCRRGHHRERRHPIDINNTTAQGDVETNTDAICNGSYPQRCRRTEKATCRWHQRSKRRYTDYRRPVSMASTSMLAPAAPID
jgi:hypothetical protein